MRVIDINDPANPFEAGFYDTNGDAQRVVVYGDYIYIADGTGGLCIFRFQEPVFVKGTDSDVMPGSFDLCENYPNPFNLATSIRYRLNTTSAVQLIVYNSVGQALRTLVDEVQTAGTRTVIWDGRDRNGIVQSNGTYLYCLKAGGAILTRKMVLMK